MICFPTWKQYMKNLLIKLIELYQKYLSFDKGFLMVLAPAGACKYDITCSQYTKEAIFRHGAVKGIILGLKRIWSCR